MILNAFVAQLSQLWTLFDENQNQKLVNNIRSESSLELTSAICVGSHNQVDINERNLHNSTNGKYHQFHWKIILLTSRSKLVHGFNTEY